jgi:alanine-synthesizing transaminase
MDFADLDLGLSPQLSNRIYEVHGRLKASGEKIVDLISGSSSDLGLNYPRSVLSRIFLNQISQVESYHPDSLGQEPARQSVSKYYSSRGLSIPPGQIVLTPGTSLSYLYCFKLLTEPGDEIICPTPTYPLFDLIARICNIHLISYRLLPSQKWRIDLDYLESRLTTRTRAIVLISPHNPTGMVASESELEGLAEIASRHQLAIISDEVFSEFLFVRTMLPRPAGTEAPLVFTLNGFSKMYALPGMKLGWIAISGDPERVKDALQTLELISDTFLPVNEWVQFAVPSIFDEGREFLSQYKKVIQCCRDLAVETFTGVPGISFTPPEGGFYLSLGLDNPAVDEEQLVIRLLEQSRVLVHPGYFYEMASPHLVMTYTQKPEVLFGALQKIKALL